MQRIKQFIQLNKVRLLLVLSALCLVTGSVMLSTGCKASLDTSGAYAQPGGGGMFLYSVDKTLVDSKETLDAFVTWEYKNHAVVETQWPAVTKAADSIRANAPGWFAAASQLRQVYVTSASIVNSNNLNSQVQLIHTAAITSGPLTNNIR